MAPSRIALRGKSLGAPPGHMVRAGSCLAPEAFCKRPWSSQLTWYSASCPSVTTLIAPAFGRPWLGPGLTASGAVLCVPRELDGVQPLSRLPEPGTASLALRALPLLRSRPRSPKSFPLRGPDWGPS